MWGTVKLGDVATVIAGQSPAGENYNKDGVGTPFMQGKKDYGDKFPNPPTVWTTSVTKLAEKGDILMSVRAPVGALNIANQQVCIGRGLAAIRASEKIELDYLFYALLQISARLEGSSGAIFNSINKKQIEEIEFLLPPLTEQQRIVAKLDAAFAEIDTMKNNQLAVSQTVSNMLPKLFSNLIDEVGAERTSTLGETCEFTQGIQIPKPEQLSVQSNDFPTRFLRIVDYTRSGKEEPRFIKEQNHRYLMKFDDVALVRYGNPGFVCRGLVGALANNLFKVIPRSNEISQDFLYYYLKSDVFQSVIRRKAHGVAMQAISFSLIKEIPFPILSTTSQAEFVKKADQLEQHIDKLQNIYDSKVHTIEKLKSAILAKELQSEAA